jgi:hypothetical protein
VTTIFSPGGHEGFVESFFDLVFRTGGDGNVSSHRVALTRGDGRYFGIITSLIKYFQRQVKSQGISYHLSSLQPN